MFVSVAERSREPFLIRQVREAELEEDNLVAREKSEMSIHEFGDEKARLNKFMKRVRLKSSSEVPRRK